MENHSRSSNAQTLPPGSVDGHSAAGVQQPSALSSLLEELDEAVQTGAAPRAKSNASHQNRLVQVRLGLASSLFTALRAKHAPTAAHSLRVALGCSSWALAIDLTDQQRDEIEVAALLHDIGKLGVPDHVLLKTGKLSAEDVLAIERHRQVGREILQSCCTSQAILDTVHYAAAWFDGRKHGFDRSGEQLPFGSRLLAIVDAFDAMTTDHVYRPAMSRERAMAELFEYAGTQFDRCLVKDFCGLLTSDRLTFNSGVARRWLQQLQPEMSNALWRLQDSDSLGGEPTRNELFQQKLLDSMHDGVVFVDTGLQILLWNRAAERLTGVPASSVYKQQWSPSLVEMRDERDKIVSDAECPVAYAIGLGVQTLRRLIVSGRNGESISLDAHVVPVVGRDGAAHGAALLLRDASRQVTLEERVQSLHEMATRDPLTQVANRAEFDRVHQQFVETHLEQPLPCSLIMCDLDQFKRINDCYGHQAGDEALVCFAGLLRRFCRVGDLVARYGGEEFVMLCADCDNATATSRADEIRRELAETPQSMLGGERITASFGVTEIQHGDTTETMLRRADRALLQAKVNGRNLVVQLGAGIGRSEKRQSGYGWLSWLQSQPPDPLLARHLITAVPLKVAAEKLRGFVSDHHAELISIDENHVALKVDGQYGPLLRRRSDRPAPFLIELKFTETRVDLEGRPGGSNLRTLIHVVIRPKRQRDRRRRDVVERARQLLLSLKSYLMAEEQTPPPAEATKQPRQKNGGGLKKAKHLVAYWLGGK